MEREISRLFGSERTPLSGGASRHTRSDSLHPRLYIEAKLKKGFTAAWRRFDEIESQAKKESKIPLLVARIQHQDNQDALVVCRIRDLKAIAGELA